MRVVGINGSARKDGNTALLMGKALEALEGAGIETELVQLAGQEVKPCRACWACGGKGNCVHKDDAFFEVFEKMKASDGIVLGSPSYLANVSSRMQAVLERAAVVSDMNPGLLARKAGASISVARRAGALQAVEAMNRFFLVQQMFVVGSSYWSIAYGQLPGEAEGDGEGVATMEALGENMAHLPKSLGRMRLS